MSCPRYCFVFQYDCLDGNWSALCIHADNLEEAKVEFGKCVEELVIITEICQQDNWHCAWEGDIFEPEKIVYSTNSRCRCCGNCGQLFYGDTCPYCHGSNNNK